MHMHHNPWLVGLSVAVAILLSHVSLGLAARISRASGGTARAWWVAGSLAMGGGIWSMHFIGMLSMELPSRLHYDPWLTLLSLVTAIAGSAGALAISSRQSLPRGQLVLGGLMLASGIVAMHYIGMAALRASPPIVLDPGWVAVSVGIALAASFAAVGLAFREQGAAALASRRRRLAAAVALGTAICGMHYTGMAAMVLPEGFASTGGVTGNPYWLAAVVAVMAVALLSVTLFASLLEAQMAARQALHARRLEIAHARLAHQVTHDALTDLYNRQGFMDLLGQRLRDCAGRFDPVCVLLVDLDRLKYVNDALGHSVGDAVLREAACRLAGLVSGRGAVARMGADNFLVLDQLGGAREVLGLAERVVRSLGAVFEVGSTTLHLSASVGATTFPFDHAPAEVLVSHADEAMYNAKRGGGNGYRFFVPGTTVHTADRLQLEDDLWHAPGRGELEVWYQPVVRVADGRIVGFEALARWHHPTRGHIPPTEFIPLAEASDVILHVGQWVLQEACSQLAEWRAQGFDGLRLAVNLSARQFRQANLEALVDQVLERHGLEPRHLALEVTESMVMTDFDRASETLRRLSERGLHIAVDDFGTGHSSLSYLKQLPVAALKIDRSFVADLGRHAASDAIVKAIVTLGQGLALEVVAEGVETAVQLAHLRRLGCDCFQGYLYSRPVTARVARELLRQPAWSVPEERLAEELLGRAG